MDVYLGHAFEEFIRSDSFMVMGKGLGMIDLLARAVKMYCHNSITSSSSSSSSNSSGGSGGSGVSSSSKTIEGFFQIQANPSTTVHSEHNTGDNKYPKNTSASMDAMDVEQGGSSNKQIQIPSSISNNSIESPRTVPSYATSVSLSKKGLVFVINLDENGRNMNHENLLTNILQKDGVSLLDMPKFITAENYSHAERIQLYNAGGCFIVTSRILIVDLLESSNHNSNNPRNPNDFTAAGLEREALSSKFLDIASITGVIVCNAHTINENSKETFIMRVYRDNNKTGFIKAITDNPMAINSGEMRSIEICMKYLYLNKLSLWPRNHPLVHRCLPEVEVESLDIKLSKLATEVQSSLLVALKQVINEIKICYNIDFEKNIEKHFTNADGSKGNDDKSANTAASARDNSKSNSNSSNSNNNSSNKSSSTSNSNNNNNNNNNKSNNSASSNSGCNSTTLSLDFALSRRFDILIRNQLVQAGYGNASSYSPKLNSLIHSIKDIRDLLESLLIYDAPSFFSELKRIYNINCNINPTMGYQAQWLSTDAGSRAYNTAQERVFKIETSNESNKNNSSCGSSSKKAKVLSADGDTKSVRKSKSADVETENIPQKLLERLHRELEIPSGMRLVPVGEVNNKWRAFLHIIESELKNGESGPILVIVKDQKASLQLQILLRGLNLQDSFSSISSSSSSSSSSCCSSNSSSSSSTIKRDNNVGSLDLLRLIADDNYRRFISNQSALIRKGSGGTNSESTKSGGYGSSNTSKNNYSGLKRSNSSTAKLDLDTLLKGNSEANSSEEHSGSSSGLGLGGAGIEELTKLIENENSSGTDASSVGSFICSKCFSMTKEGLMKLKVENRLILIEEYKLNNTKTIRAIDSDLAIADEDDVMGRPGDDIELDDDDDNEEGPVNERVIPRAKPPTFTMKKKNDIINYDAADDNSPTSKAAGSSEYSMRIISHTRNGVDCLHNGGRYNHSSSVSPTRQVVIVTHENAYNSSNIVIDVSPTSIVLYDMDLSIVRNIEVYQALLQRASERETLNSFPPKKTRCKLYSLVYLQSSEQFRYTSTVEKEKKIFDSFNSIKESLCVILPDSKTDIEKARKEDSLFTQDSRAAYRELSNVNLTSGGGSSSSSSTGSSSTNSIRNLYLKHHQKPICIVDMREFRCSLPHMLYMKGFQIVPKNLTIADYVISPTIGIERKAIDDLFQSFISGRLFTQMENLCRHYEYPCLLIEFQATQPFCLQSESEIPTEMRTTNISTKISVLTLSFPKLRIFWTRSSTDTADLLMSLLLKKDFEPLNSSIDEVSGRGGGSESNTMDDLEVMDSARDLLMSIPGINTSNYRSIIEKFGSISEIASKSQNELVDAVGQTYGHSIYKFFRQKTI